MFGVCQILNLYKIIASNFISSAHKSTEDTGSAKNLEMTKIKPADRVVLCRDGQRWFLIRPSDGKAAFLGFPNPVLAVRNRENNVYGMCEAFVYQKGSHPSSWFSASTILSGDDAFTLIGTGSDAKLAQRCGIMWFYFIVD